MKKTTIKEDFERELKEQAKKEIKQKQAAIIKRAILRRKLEGIFAV